ncbi:FCS-Like Zinc finger 11 [Cardamine amara subsp. amara]|uniref:FCS-Like Zinc finger 11 n=1 Tax=Cardamine amara subsp. amara TaxID=228776 RepID=A0ABD1C519_CARAN
MLKTRAMFPQKDQPMSLVPDPVGQNNNNNNIIKPITNPLALSLLIGLNNNKCISDSDFVRSPKSPLEFRVLSTMADPFFLRSPRSSLTAHLNCCCVVPSTKVGLSIVDSLGDDRSLLPDVVFGSSLRIKSSEIREKCTKLAPKTIEKERSGVVFEIGDDSFESEPIGLRNRSFFANDCLRKIRVLSPSKLGAEADFQGIDSNGAFSSCLSEEDMEDYTCIIAHGPNPKTTHIYGDRVLECHENELKVDDENKEKHIKMQFDTMATLDNFLSLCNFCNKKLEVGEDIYMYREKAFCSAECREEEMMIDEEDLEDSFITMDESLKKLF